MAGGHGGVGGDDARYCRVTPRYTYSEHQMSNGASTHVCATRGPDLRTVNDVRFYAFGAPEWWRGGAEDVSVRNIGFRDRWSGSDGVCYKERPGLL